MKNNRNSLFSSTLTYLVIFLILIAGFGYFMRGNSGSASEQIKSSEFIADLKQNDVKDFSIQPDGSIYKVTGTYRKAQKSKQSTGIGLFSNTTTSSVKQFTTIVPGTDSSIAKIQNLAAKNDVKNTTNAESQSGTWISVLLTIVPMFLILIFFYMMMNQSGQGGGGNRMMSFGKSRAKQADKGQNKVRFSDVAGAEEEKQELVEVVEFLKDPRKFASLGARIPSGVLLEGPPGTGKTLLAKAVAGEAGVPFFSISGSDFVEMFVGVGASRVRDLFEEAKKKAPAIIFIDEIDAVGRQRGTGMGGGHDEREQTLNQLLVEMDGFTGNEGVIVMAATNRSDVLDPALLRPGRFDRKILVGQPDVKGREAILKVHAKNKPLADDVNLKTIAKQTPGFVGADLENLLNEAALVAARRNKKAIDASDVDEAEDRVIAGPAKKDRVISEKERRMVAFHEAGHALIGLVLSDSRVVRKVTIIPRGRAGGYAITLPKEDQFLMSKKDLNEQITGMLGGRTAEEIIFDQESTGASNDFEQATQIARGMVTTYGMSKKIGTVTLEREGGQPFVGAQYGQGSGYSEATAAAIDSEVREIIDAAHKRAYDIIQAHREQHKNIAEALLKYETLNEEQILSIFNTGKMPEKKGNEFPSEKAATFEESKAALEQREAAKQADGTEDTAATAKPAAPDEDAKATEQAAAPTKSEPEEAKTPADDADAQHKQDDDQE
ncbi:ATP-dependent zinc metalloprotease FtsH [Lacticaseibacillus sharpeae]|uniref:ATP-dependent zinc metalloprotease FtsH n=1 Tax=Lacticaseibacillus sharpeae JCM 1186 = DSM 20505 TaxID=1291052 RepID=A0A0R1ZMH7_9LACO|nr:ATP-dependent zinc metalloprotease FtsH [Lacticaseibacillus sharpeae]KRM56189.1 ATP-dependent Zn protease [Lacticaseibacillus sharpeae JCM 1186 = DSM 20505]